MNILLIGPQGSGKGTQARLLVEKFGFSYFESGAYLRRMAETHPDIKKMMNEGKLVPDLEFTSYLTAYLDSQRMYDNIIFDGFPRTVSQYNFLKDWLIDKEVKLDLAIVLKISEDETVRRLTGRRLDPKTGKIYNLVTETVPPEVDKDKLVQRADDKPEAITKRLQVYKEQTEPLIEELRKDSKVVEVDGERSVNDISKDLEEIIQNMESKEGHSE